MLSGAPAATLSAEQLLDRFVAAGERQRRTQLIQLQQRASELAPLIPACLERFEAGDDDWAAGCLIQLFLQHAPDALREPWQQRFAAGWLPLDSSAGLDLVSLQWLLASQDFEEADRLTSSMLRELAGPAAVTRGYVYYSEVPPMPLLDLQSLDRLWVLYSQGRFGFSVQARLLRSCGGRWDRLWPRIGWKQAGIWTRYPGSFTWSLAAPDGHLPLVNQLRGVRLMDSLLGHPAVQQRV